jgi:hypothetical protein
MTLGWLRGVPSTVQIARKVVAAPKIFAGDKVLGVFAPLHVRQGRLDWFWHSLSSVDVLLFAIQVFVF